MKGKSGKIVRTIYSCVFLAFSILLIALFLWQVLSILAEGAASGGANESGQGSYTQEIVGSRLKMLSPALWIWLALVVGAIVIWNVFPVKQKIATNDAVYTLKKLEKRLPMVIPEGLQEDYRLYKEHKRISLFVKLFAAIISACVGVYFITYLCLPGSFTASQNATEEILALAKRFVALIFAAMLVWCAALKYEEESAKNVLANLKKLAAGQPERKRAFRLSGVLDNKWALLGIRVTVLAVAIAFIIWGSLNGNMKGILDKAIKICSECIGLG